MKPSLRHIAVTVVQRRDSNFTWQLLEQDREAPWFVLEEGEDSWTRYAAAMSAGLARLESLVDDLAAGPRHPLSEPGKAPAGAADPADDSTDSAEPRRTPGTLFGFGPMR